MLDVKTNPAVTAIFKNYPNEVRPKMNALRKLILETAEEMEDVTTLEETLKWGEPSYLTKKGSTIRIDWKAKTPNQYSMYLQCTSKLIPTFKLIYHNVFEFEGSRAIIFPLEEEIPKAELKKCIATALKYHRIKHLPTLGL
ncbi:DUF1801 domain-containing protein [Flavobacteriaceae bacterium S356]|uniref:DUF1801 domain-containing protein n=1 Tax=Asprobacillus argus TaxID=3076534 RepID=A0ABU3LG32_9FLAO|nr:DUF1801 domain-containing protein [Flavobacteriaceae bacterium S356]